jgi:AcrR family transcriptional regulator
MKYDVGTMDKRRYVQRARATATEATRRRILDAARATLENGPVGAMRVDEVARNAGVARSTIYVIFGSRAGLFDALADDLRTKAGFNRLIAADTLPDGLDAMRAGVREGTRLYGALPHLARALWTMSAIDPDAVAAVRRLDDGRAPAMINLATRLRRGGYLRKGVSIRAAADILWVITSFPTFDQLFLRGLSVDAIAARLTTMAERSLLAEPADA